MAGAAYRMASMLARNDRAVGPPNDGAAADGKEHTLAYEKLACNGCESERDCAP